jgi:hypothetical protein
MPLSYEVRLNDPTWLRSKRVSGDIRIPYWGCRIGVKSILAGFPTERNRIAVFDPLDAYYIYMRTAL